MSFASLNSKVCHSLQLATEFMSDFNFNAVRLLLLPTLADLSCGLTSFWPKATAAANLRITMTTVLNNKTKVTDSI